MFYVYLNLQLLQQDSDCDCKTYLLHWAERFIEKPRQFQMHSTSWFLKSWVVTKSGHNCDVIYTVDEKNIEEAIQ